MARAGHRIATKSYKGELVSDSKWRVKARIDGRPVDFTPYRQRSGRISILLLKNPRPDEEQHLTRLALRRLTEDDVPHLGTATLQSITADDHPDTLVTRAAVKDLVCNLHD